jgi:hypothetical protein
VTIGTLRLTIFDEGKRHREALLLSEAPSFDRKASGQIMLFFVRFVAKQPSKMAQRELYSIWTKEAETALAAKQAGVVKALYKVSG